MVAWGLRYWGTGWGQVLGIAPLCRLQGGAVSDEGLCITKWLYIAFMGWCK
jgi:hypothetical protein